VRNTFAETPEIIIAKQSRLVGELNWLRARHDAHGLSLGKHRPAVVSAALEYVRGTIPL